MSAPPTAGVRSRGASAAQIAIVLSVGVGWLLALDVSGVAWLLHEAWPAGAVFVHVIANGLVALAAVALVLRQFGESWGSAGLVPARIGVAVGSGLAAIVPCYVMNIFLSVTYLAASGAGLVEAASEKMEALEVLSPISGAWVVPVSLFVGVYEEILFRGFLLSRVRTLIRPSAGGAGAAWAAVLLSSALFGLLHGYQGWLGVFQTFGVGLVLAGLATWRRSVWPCIVAHAGFDMVGLFVVQFVRPVFQEALQATSLPGSAG